jgi:hypothetical protein
MSTKQLEIATDVCILVGMFLLAIPSLFGVENTVRWLLRRRERLLRIQRYLTLADKEVIVGTPDIRDLKKEDEGKAFIFYPWRPQYLIPSIALFGLLAWYVITRNSAFMMGYFEPIIEWLTIAHGTIVEYLGTWGYLLYPVIGILGLFLIGVAYVFLFIPFLNWLSARPDVRWVSTVWCGVYNCVFGNHCALYGPGKAFGLVCKHK